MRSTGGSADAVVLVECRSDYVPRYSAGRAAFLAGIDAMTGAVLWTSQRGWSLLGRATLSPDAVPIGRGEDEIGSLNPRTGSPRWTATRTDDQSCNAAGFGVTAVARSIVVVDACGDSRRLRVLDGRSGAERVIAVTAPGLAESGPWARTDIVAADGDVVVLKTSDAEDHRVALVVDTVTGAVVPLPARGYLPERDSVDAGQYPGPVLQLGDDSGQESIRLYRLDERRTFDARPVRLLADRQYSGQLWAEVGDTMVAASGYSDRQRYLAIVGPDGVTTRRPSPCGRDAGGVMTAPGATLILCERRTGDQITGYDILGMR